MFSKEKLIIRLNLFIRNLLYHILFWYGSLSFFIFLTDNKELFSNYFKLFNIHQVYITILLLSGLIATLFSFFDRLFSDRLMRFAPIRLILFIRTIFYFLLGFFVLLFSFQSFEAITNIHSFTELTNLFPEINTPLIRFIVWFFLSCFFNNFFKEMVKKIGKGNFRNWALGFMNKPREEERIFMFIDMKASTTFAEKMKHKKFSHLVQDVFNDMAVVDNYHGQIYQYLGDGAIISWTLAKGLRNSNFIAAFFAFSELVEKRSKYYQRKYGLDPKFKAGIHVGKVMVLQVGRIRRDISYNGDTLNTTARIESMCNEFKQNLLISGDLYDIMPSHEGYTFKNMDSIKLKGKRKATEIYGVRRKTVRQKKKVVPKAEKQ